MRRMIKNAAVCWLGLAFLLATTGPVFAADEDYVDGIPTMESRFIDYDLSGEAMLADTLLVRPVGIVATLLGTTMFVVSLPFSLAGGNTGAAFEKLMAEPAGFTFARPLGLFHY